MVQRVPAPRHLAAALLLALASAGGCLPFARGPSGPATLVIPVRGVSADELRDSYTEPRSGGRTHYALDIPAPRNTPVLAADDGVILKLQRGGLGGITIYQLASDGRTRFYYAHLRRYARGLREGKRVRRGQVIGYVGDTGNAGPGNYHLHFSVALLRDPKRWWEGENLNPYLLLRGSAADSALYVAPPPPSAH